MRLSLRPLSLFATTLCCIVKIFTIAKGRYQVEITLFQYNNTPPGKCHDCHFTGSNVGDLVCCDNLMNFGTCHYDELCDVYFTYCLRPFGSTGRGCFNYTNVTSSVENDLSSFSFPQQDMNVLGLPNPLLLPGLKDAYTGEGVQLYIEIRDADPPSRDPTDDMADELIDTLLIDHNEPVGEESATRVHSGMYQFVSMELVTIVKCVPGFTGPDCQQIDYCVRVNCSGNGQCVNGVDSFTCSCEPGFTGELCQTNIDDCSGITCLGNGLCIDGIANFSCSCSAGYTGKNCEENIDDCLVNTCGMRGHCVDGVNTFTCDCDPGFTGELCQTNVDDCVGVTCSGNVGGSIGAMIGGVIGAVIFIIILTLSVVLAVVIAMKWRKEKWGTRGQDFNHGLNENGLLPEKELENPIYGEGQSTDNTAVYAIPSKQQNDTDYEFDNPIYDRNAN